jgi:hypothetical protein
MSAVKRTLRRVLRAWLNGEIEAPQLLRRCEVCGEEAWRALPAAIRTIEINARLANGARADVLLKDARGGIQLVIQVDGGSRLPNRVDPHSGLPMVMLRAATLDDEPGRWPTLREAGLPGWPCRCAGTRALSVDEDFSLRAIGCPIRLRHDGTRYFARVIEDCGLCSFFVGIGYVGTERRRIQLRCGFGASPQDERERLARREPAVRDY